MKTVRGIYTDITESDYTFEIVDLGITFYFSSQFYRNNFENRYKKEIHRFNQSLNNIYKDKFNIAGDCISLIRLYALIEKRGFYFTLNGVEIKCPEDLRFVVIPTYKPKSEE